LPGPTPTPSPQPTSQPDRNVARPAAGMYLGGTSQGRAAKVRVAASRTKVGSLTLGFKLRCTRHRPVSLSLSTRSFDLKGLRFSLTAVRHSNERVRITGLFNTAGAVKGTLGATWHSRAYGTCRSGPVHWSGWTPTA
jgi:hypothetical protein